jgi:hypothetical protein
MNVLSKVLLVASHFNLWLWPLRPGDAAHDMPGKGVTRSTGPRHLEHRLFSGSLGAPRPGRTGLQSQTRAKDLQNPIFYKSVALGDVDYWTNGWFPNHDSQLPKNFYDKAGAFGYVVKAGGLQGYLVSKKEVEKSTSNRWMTSNAKRSWRLLTKTATARPT